MHHAEKKLCVISTYAYITFAIHKYVSITPETVCLMFITKISHSDQKIKLHDIYKYKKHLNYKTLHVYTNNYLKTKLLSVMRRHELHTMAQFHRAAKQRILLSKYFC